MQTYCGDGFAAWQGAAERLQRGAELLAKRLDQDDRYYAAAAELQKRWKLKVLAPESFLVAPPKCIGIPFEFSRHLVLCKCSAPAHALLQHAGRHYFADCIRLTLCHAFLSHGNISRLCNVQGRQPWSFRNAYRQSTHRSRM